MPVKRAEVMVGLEAEASGLSPSTLINRKYFLDSDLAGERTECIHFCNLKALTQCAKQPELMGYYATVKRGELFLFCYRTSPKIV